MHHPALLTVTRTLVVVVGSLGILAALVHDGGAEPVVLASATDGARPVVELPAPSVTGAPAPSSSTTTPSSTTTATTSTTTTTSPPSTAPPTTPPPPTTAPPATAPPTTAAPTTTPSAPAQSCESDLARLVNQARTGRGLATVAMDGAILDVARSWTRQLVSTGELRHNPDFASQVFGGSPARSVGRV